MFGQSSLLEWTDFNQSRASTHQSMNSVHFSEIDWQNRNFYFFYNRSKISLRSYRPELYCKKDAPWFAFMLHSFSDSSFWLIANCFLLCSIAVTKSIAVTHQPKHLKTRRFLSICLAHFFVPFWSPPVKTENQSVHNAGPIYV